MSGFERGARFDEPLSKLEPSAAELAEAAVDWLLPQDVGLEALSQLDVQEFLWHQLPNKWMTSTRELHEVAWALRTTSARAAPNSGSSVGGCGLG